MPHQATNTSRVHFHINTLNPHLKNIPLSQCLRRSWYMYLQALQATLAGYLTPSPCRAFINSSFNNLSARTSAGKKNANMTGTTNDFYSKENLCKDTFIKLDNAWHLWTSENFELIFKTPGDFLSGMNILGICAMMHKELKINELF